MKIVIDKNGGLFDIVLPSGNTIKVSVGAMFVDQLANEIHRQEKISYINAEGVCTAFWEVNTKEPHL
jgi:hypothetical protein